MTISQKLLLLATLSIAMQNYATANIPKEWEDVGNNIQERIKVMNENTRQESINIYKEAFNDLPSGEQKRVIFVHGRPWNVEYNPNQPEYRKNIPPRHVMTKEDLFYLIKFYGCAGAILFAIAYCFDVPNGPNTPPQLHHAVK